jgi:membrane protease YdiL (CAAX protease family)
MNKEKITIVIRYVTYVLMVLAVVFEGLILFHGDEKLAQDGGLQGSVLAPFIGLSYGSVLFPAGLALIFPIIHLLDNPKTAKGILIGVGALLGVFVIAYLVSSSAIDGLPEGTSEGTSKWVSTGINTFYLLSLIAVGSIVYTEVSRFFK